MKTLLIAVFFSYSAFALANNEIWLQDIDCKVIGPKGNVVLSIKGSLITYICTKNEDEITCSNSSNTDNMAGGNPSAITKYKEVIIDNEFAVWKAASHEGMLILDIKNKRYSVSQTTLLGEGLVNKNCVGEVKNY